MRPSTFPLLDRVLDGQLAETLRHWRAVEGMSFADVVRRLDNDHDVTVSIETVRRWCIELGIEKGSAERQAS